MRGGGGCAFTLLVRYVVGVAIANRTFADPDGSFAGTFSADRNARGTLQLTVTDGADTCRTPALTWTAATDATPPWVPPPPPPPPPPPAAAIKLGATSVQRALKQGGIVVSVRCAARPCKARVTGTMVAARTTRTAKLTSAARSLAARATGKVTLRLSPAARRYVTSALNRGRSARAKVSARFTDSAGRVTTKRTTIRIRR